MWSDFPQNTNSVLWEITRANESNVHFCWRSTFQCYFLQSQAGPCCAPGRNAFYVWSFLSPAAFHRIHGSPECHISIHHLVFIANTGCCQRAIKQQWFAIVIAYIMDKKRPRGRESESKIVVAQETARSFFMLYCGQRGSPRQCSFSVSSPLIERCEALCAYWAQNNSANMIWITLFLLHIFPNLLALPNMTVVSLFTLSALCFRLQLDRKRYFTQIYPCDLPFGWVVSVFF